jgi:hypothetical protein
MRIAKNVLGLVGAGLLGALQACIVVEEPRGRATPDHSLTRTRVEAPGASCPAGGTRIEFGYDKNRDGKLSDPEITGSAMICDGAAAEGAMVVTTDLPVGSPECPEGGTRIDSGLDRDGNRVLDEGEFTSAFVCAGTKGADGKDGADGQNGIDGSDGIDGQNGADGIDGADGKNGKDGKNGVDGKDADGKDGADGNDGYASLIKLSSEPAGANCVAGG